MVKQLTAVCRIYFGILCIVSCNILIHNGRPVHWAVGLLWQPSVIVATCLMCLCVHFWRRINWWCWWCPCQLFEDRESWRMLSIAYGDLWLQMCWVVHHCMRSNVFRQIYTIYVQFCDCMKKSCKLNSYCAMWNQSTFPASRFLHLLLEFTVLNGNGGLGH